MKRKLRIIQATVVLFVVSILSVGAEAGTESGGASTAPDIMWLTWIGSIAALLFGFFMVFNTLKRDAGNKIMRDISHSIQTGATAYLAQQYKVVGIFFGFLFILFLILSLGLHMISVFVPFAFITGGFFSGLAGYIGMFVATRSNSRTAWAASTSLNAGLRTAFSSGAVMGMVVVGLGLLDLSIWWLVLKLFGVPVRDIPPIMITFGMGASSMALFARLGGGIFTKAADVGADLVGKVEVGIPEDDPRNPATIADNVGDNVGDVAGMGADLYESYVGSIVATMALGEVASWKLPDISELQLIQIPVAVASIGVLCSIIGTFFVRAREDATQKVLLGALRTGIYVSTILIAIVSFVIIFLSLGRAYVGIWGALIAGLLAGNVIGYSTERYTSENYTPTRKLSAQSLTGPATMIIEGLSLGMVSTLVPILSVVFATLSAFFLSGGLDRPGLGLYGIGLAAVGMLSTLGITLATDAYGPVADNAGGIAEMSKLEPKVRERTDALDALGNTTAATGKGFAIGSAALTALALLAEYGNKIKEAIESLFNYRTIPTHIEQINAGLLHVTRGFHGIIEGIQMSIDLLDPRILVGLFLGGVLPFVFSAFSMRAVGRAAGEMVKEVRRQFREKPGIMKGTEKPDYAVCVAISTKSAQKEMISPSVLAISAPILVGILLGPFTVIAMLAAALASGFVLAIMMANAGGAWDNAKKYIEKGAHGGKGSPAHAAAVVGDTVGDPMKDTSGPAINILLKLMSMVSIVFVPVYLALNELILAIF